VDVAHRRPARQPQFSEARRSYEFEETGGARRTSPPGRLFSIRCKEPFSVRNVEALVLSDSDERRGLRARATMKVPFELSKCASPLQPPRVETNATNSTRPDRRS